MENNSLLSKAYRQAMKSANMGLPVSDSDEFYKNPVVKAADALSGIGLGIPVSQAIPNAVKNIQDPSRMVARATSPMTPDETIGMVMGTFGGGKNIKLYRGLTKEFNPRYDLSSTDAPHGYSTWTDNKELAKQYAGKDGYVYEIELPKNKLGKELLNSEGDRELFVNNEKPAGLNNIKGNEYLVYNEHDLYNPEMVKLLKSENPQSLIEQAGGIDDKSIVKAFKDKEKTIKPKNIKPLIDVVKDE